MSPVLSSQSVGLATCEMTAFPDPGLPGKMSARIIQVLWKDTGLQILVGVNLKVFGIGYATFYRVVPAIMAGIALLWKSLDRPGAAVG